MFSYSATRGNNVQEWLANRQIVDYPSVFDPRPIERAYASERLFLTMPPGVLVSDIKWLTVWCEIFGISFGDVVFPDYVKNSI